MQIFRTFYNTSEFCNVIHIKLGQLLGHFEFQDKIKGFKIRGSTESLEEFPQIWTQRWNFSSYRLQEMKLDWILNKRFSLNFNSNPNLVKTIVTCVCYQLKTILTNWMGLRIRQNLWVIYKYKNLFYIFYILPFLYYIH